MSNIWKGQYIPWELPSSEPAPSLERKKKNPVNTHENYNENILSDVTCGQVRWPILEIRALHLTHPKCTHTAVNTHREHTPGAVCSHLCCSARGAVGGLVPCSRAPQPWYWGWRERCKFTPPTYKSYQPKTRTQPLDYESDSITIRPRLPLAPCKARQWQGSGKAVARQWQGSGKAVARQWQGSGKAVARLIQTGTPGSNA